MKQIIPLTKQQNEIMGEFYGIPKTKVIFNKNERNEIWNLAKKKSLELTRFDIKNKCPALYHQIYKSYECNHNIQSAVFSECVYAQTYANMMMLDTFINCFEIDNYLPSNIELLLNSYHLVPRYIYSTKDKRRMLIQAGGCDGIDSALITVIDLVIYTIEFKEPGAKTSEPDLPKYKEDGNFIMNDKWLNANPQFKYMVEECKNINFFEIMGSNFNDFSIKSVDYAVSSNYIGKKKFADVICTEDKNGYLVMLPTNQVSSWAHIEGEIRPAGRNHYNVWTPIALRNFIAMNGGKIIDNKADMPLENLTLRKERGSNIKASGYKINPLFFVYLKNCKVSNGRISFLLKDVRQLNPTIAGKMFFKTLNYDDVLTFYFGAK